MDMFYNNPIRTLLVLFCMLFVSGNIFAQCDEYEVQGITNVRYLGCTDAENNFPDLGIALSVNGAAPSINIGQSDVTSFIPGTPSNLDAAGIAALNAAALFPSPIFIAAPGGTNIQAIAWEAGAGVATPTLVTVPLPAAVGVSQVTVTYPCYAVTYQIRHAVLPVPSIANVTVCQLAAAQAVNPLDNFSIAAVQAAYGSMFITGPAAFLPNTNTSGTATAPVPTADVITGTQGIIVPANQASGTYNFTVTLFNAFPSPPGCRVTVPFTITVVNSTVTAVSPLAVSASCTGVTTPVLVRVPTGAAPPTGTLALSVGGNGVYSPVLVSSIGGVDTYEFRIANAFIPVVPVVAATLTVSNSACPGVAPVQFTLTQGVGGSTLSCNAFINLSLGAGCAALITPAMVLNIQLGAPGTPNYNGYTISLLDLAGNVIAGPAAGNAGVTVRGMGTYKYEVTAPCGEKCWGNIEAKDKVAPTCTAGVAIPALNCSVPLAGLEPVATPLNALGQFDLPTTNPLFVYFRRTGNLIGGITASTTSSGFGRVVKTAGVGKVHEGTYDFTNVNAFLGIEVVVRQNGTDYVSLTINDGCGISQIGYTDNVVENCDATGLVRTVTRNWYAVDVNGNRSALNCNTVFTFTKPVTTSANILIPGETGYPTTAITNGAFAMIPCDAPAALSNASALNTEVTISDVIYYYTTGVPVVMTANGVVALPSAREGASNSDEFSRMCMITSTYKDDFIPGCTASVGKIVRKWTVIDMCTKVTKTGTQIITVMAPTPTFAITNEDKSCGSQATNGAGTNRQTMLPVRSVITDAGACNSNATLLNIDISGQKCGTTVTDAVVTITDRRENWACDAEDAMRGVSFPIVLRGLDAKIPNLPAGEYSASVYVTNNCGVSSAASNFVVRITDREAPTAISIDKLVISLTNSSNGSTRVYATQLDKGSRDNCGLARTGALQVGLSADGPFAEFVIVNCTINPMVFLRVTDCAIGREVADANGNGTRCQTVSVANTNTVMVPIELQDKSAPQCQAPGNMVMTCESWVELKKVVGSGIVAAGADNAAVIERLRSMAGSFTSISSCSGVAKETYEVNVSACGEGSVVRTYTITKPGVPTATCTQTVRFVSNKPQNYVATFPKDITTQDCTIDPTKTGRPQIDSSSVCENIQVTYSDEVFVNKNTNPLDPAGSKTCRKIVRTWKVINMCIYDPTLQNYLPNADADCVYRNTSAVRGSYLGFTGTDASRVFVYNNNTNYLRAFESDGTTVGTLSQVAPAAIAPNYLDGVYLSDYFFGANQRVPPTTGPNGVTGNGSFNARYAPAGPYTFPTTAAWHATDPTCYNSNADASGVNGAWIWGARGRKVWLTLNANNEVRVRDRAGDGVIRYVQVINVEDNINPTFTTTCPKPEVTTTVLPKTVTDCRGTIELTNTATDNCAGDVSVEVTVVSPDRDFTAADGSAVVSKYVGKGDKGTYTGTVDVPLNKVLTVIWSATDVCGNVSTCSYKINVPDTKAPIVVCRDLSTELMALGTNSMLDLTADKFVLMATDNCTDMATMMASASFDAAGTQKTRRFTCTDIRTSGIVDVQIYVRDAAGNTNFCRTNAFFRPEDRTACGFNGSTASVAGLIQNETSEGVEKVTVKMNADAGVTAIETGTDGKFNYNLPLNKDYSVNPAKTTGLLNGVSTYDLVLIQKHILDVEKLNSSYKVVAADVNKDGKVTTLDIVELRKAILRISSTFPNGNNSWRFVSKNYAFSSTEGAAGETFPETYNINNLKAQQKADFVGVKVGDVNESAAPNSLIGAEERGARKAFVMTAEDRIVKAGEEVTMNVVADAANVAGFQYTMNFDKNALEFAGVKAGAINVTDANVAVVEGALTTSWNGEATNGNLFTVVFRAKADGRLSELVNVNSRYTEAEAYTKQAETMNVELRFNGTAANGFALFQNQPNPFTKETIIGFNLPSAQAATLKVYDVTGKAVKVVNADYAKGYNEVKIADLKATGVLYYTLETQGFTATKKMVIVE